MSLDRESLLRTYLVEVRVEAGLTQAALARQLGKHQSYISKIETGERRIDLIELLDLLEAVQIDAMKFVRTLAERLHAGQKAD